MARLSSSKRLMRVLRPIVEAATDLLAIGIADLLHRRRISAKPVGDDRPRSVELLHDALEKLQRCGVAPLRSDDRFQNLALMALLSDLGSKHRTKPVPPKSDSLMASVDPTLGPEILDIAQRQRVSHLHHHDQPDPFWRAVEISERVTHGPKLPQPKTARKIGLKSRTSFTPLIQNLQRLQSAALRASAALLFGARSTAQAHRLTSISNKTRPSRPRSH
jgi:hypothetical protein